jgi:hypothetical protein
MVQDFGHPFLDNLLLLVSGLLLAALALLVGALFILKAGREHPFKERLLVYAVLIAVGGLLTWLCNRILRQVKR